MLSKNVTAADGGLVTTSRSLLHVAHGSTERMRVSRKGTVVSRVDARFRALNSEMARRTQLTRVGDPAATQQELI